MAVEPSKLAGKMGLRVKVREITEDTSIFDQIYFHDSNAEFYNPTGAVIKHFVRYKTTARKKSGPGGHPPGRKTSPGFSQGNGGYQKFIGLDNRT